MGPEQGILAVNAGSSSVKFGLYVAQPSGDLQRRARLMVSDLGRQPRLAAPEADGTRNYELAPGSTHTDAISCALDWFSEHHSPVKIASIGHRVVHGGVRFVEPTLITPEVLKELSSFNELAPLHEPHNLRGIETLMEAAPGIPQVACFDTAFHRTMSGPAASFALPRRLAEEGIRRYGFHGLSYEYIAGVLPEYLGSSAEGRVIVAHLGHGASMCAMRHRRSVATTMSMTPLDGLPMGTRCGQLDPGVVLFMLSTLGLTVAAVSHILYEESGLLGVSGVSAYMDALLASEDPHAAEAVDLFIDACARAIGSLAAALDGFDAIVFTAGIGEHGVEVRRRILERIAWLGVRIDPAANRTSERCISSDDSRVSCWVIPTDEEVVVARHVATLLGRLGHHGRG